jgi:xylulokinase
VTGCAQEIPRYRRGASYGDALLAARAAGLAPAGADWTAVDHVVEPNSTLRERYDALYAVYRDLYPATAGAMHALATLQGVA